MKKRRVVVTLEMETSAPIKVLKEQLSDWVIDGADDELIQIQINVIKPEKK